MRPAVMVCTPCNLKVEAEFATNEFASLSEDDLHFLRIFVHTEGHIRDMESALGVSYPTVKARLSDLKQRLQTGMNVVEKVAGEDETARALRDLEAGKITYEQAIDRLRGKREKP